MSSFFGGMNERRKLTVGLKIQSNGFFLLFFHVDALVLRLLCENFHDMIEVILQKRSKVDQFKIF